MAFDAIPPNLWGRQGMLPWLDFLFAQKQPISTLGRPYFYVDKDGSNQTLTGTSAELVTWTNTNVVDTASGFDDANDKYVIQEAGLYWVQTLLSFNLQASGDRLLTHIYLDTGSGAASVRSPTSLPGNTSRNGVFCSALLDLNVDDELLIYGQNADFVSGDRIDGPAAVTWWELVKIGAAI